MNEIPKGYEHTTYAQDPGSTNFSPQIESELGDLIPSMGRILDLACGTGTLSHYISPDRYVGLDVSQCLIGDFWSKGSADFVLGDIQDIALPFSDKSFKCVFFKDAVVHLDDHQRGDLFKEVHRVLARRGRFIIVSAFHRFNSMVCLKENDGSVRQYIDESTYSNMDEYMRNLSGIEIGDGVGIEPPYFRVDIEGLISQFFPYICRWRVH